MSSSTSSLASPPPAPRPLLTARWTELLMLSFAVPAEMLARRAPPGVQPALYDGQAYASIVGFRFSDTRLWGIRFPGHVRFDEINLRFYVRRMVAGSPRRGVVFLQEIAPRRAVALVANRLYRENYVVRPMQSQIEAAGGELAAGDRLEYRWRVGGDWQRLGGQVAGPLELPAAGSFEEFIVEQYWGYGRHRDGSAAEYAVTHPRWRVAPVANVTWSAAAAACFADSPLLDYLAVAPASALVADGSAVEVFRAQRLGDAGSPACEVREGKLGRPAHGMATG